MEGVELETKVFDVSVSRGILYVRVPGVGGPLQGIGDARSNDLFRYRPYPKSVYFEKGITPNAIPCMGHIRSPPDRIIISS